MDFEALTGAADSELMPSPLQTAADLVFIASIPKAQLLAVNAAFGAVLGYKAVELRGKILFDYLHAEDREGARTLVSSESSKTWELVARFRRKSGDYPWIEWRGHAHTGSWIVTGRDISERILLEQALRDSEARLALAAESARLGTFDYYPGAGTLVCSRISCEMVGIEPSFAERYRRSPSPVLDSTRGRKRAEQWEFDQTAYEQLATLVSLEDLGAAADALLDLQSGRQINWVRKFKALDGEVRYLRVLASPEFDVRGALCHIRGTVQDVTGPETVRTRLREERNQFEAYLESAPEGVILIDASGRMLLVNRRLETMFGYQRAELLGNPVDILLPERLAGSHARHRATFFSAPDRRPMGRGVTFPGLRKDGTEFPVEVGLNWIRREDEVVALALVTDATVRTAREAERQQMLDALRDLGRRLDEVRELERKKIAHEIHDGLGQELVALKMGLALVGSKLLGSKLPPDLLPAAQRVGEMTMQVESMIRTIQRVATNLRPDVLDRLGLSPALEWLISEFEKNEGIACTRSIEEVDADTPTANAIFRIVQESLTNVLRHAGATQVWLTLAVKDGNIEVEIRDDGNGILPEDLQKPAATGLASAQERIVRAGGSMEIMGQPGEGAVIRLSLPQEGPSESEIMQLHQRIRG